MGPESGDRANERLRLHKELAAPFLLGPQVYSGPSKDSSIKSVPSLEEKDTREFSPRGNTWLCPSLGFLTESQHLGAGVGGWGRGCTDVRWLGGIQFSDRSLASICKDTRPGRWFATALTK